MLLQVAEFVSQQDGPDGISTFEMRLDGLRRVMPPRGVIGYLSDPKAPRDDLAVAAEYYLTQYSLAPVIVVRGADQRFVIGNFHRLPVDPAQFQPRGLALERDFGEGVVLLRRDR